MKEHIQDHVQELKRVDTDETASFTSSATEKADIQHGGQFETALLDVEETDRMFLKASFITIVVWLFCICLVFSSSTPTERLEGTEREAASIAFWMLFVIFIVVWLLTSWPTSKTSISGILVASLTVQMIAMATNALLAWYPTIVIVDQVTGARVFVLRWCEVRLIW